VCKRTGWNENQQQGYKNGKFSKAHHGLSASESSGTRRSNASVAGRVIIPLLVRRGGCAGGADGVVIHKPCQFGVSHHPGVASLRPPLLKKEGNKQFGGL
jgi:hypothetical protein